jgi:hypothetical protein
MLQGLKGVSLFLCASCRIMVSRRALLIRRHLRSPYLKGPRFVGQVVRGALWAGPAAATAEKAGDGGICHKTQRPSVIVPGTIRKNYEAASVKQAAPSPVGDVRRSFNGDAGRNSFHGIAGETWVRIGIAQLLPISHRGSRGEGSGRELTNLEPI